MEFPWLGHQTTVEKEAGLYILDELFFSVHKEFIIITKKLITQNCTNIFESHSKK